VGLAGCGEIAGRYARALSAAPRLALELAAVTDVDAAAGRSFAAAHGLRFASSLDELLALPLDLICVCTPNATHAPIAMRALEAGHHVLVEHPMAMTTADAEALIEAAATARRRLLVVRQRRFSRTMQILRTAFCRRLIGDIESVDLKLHWSRRSAYFDEKPWRRSAESGGVIANQASHFLDLLLYLFGEPQELAGAIGNVRHAIDCEDSARGTIAFANGLHARFECTTAAPDGCNASSLTIQARHGAIRVGGRDLDRFIEPLPPALASIADTLAEPLSGDHRGYLERVARFLGGEPVEVVDGGEGARAVRLIERIYATFHRDDGPLRAHFALAFGESAA
jgi:predicted dehydrogenase